MSLAPTLMKGNVLPAIMQGLLAFYVAAVCCIPLPSYAGLPIPQAITSIDDYPDYPTIDYTRYTRAQAESIRRGEYLAKLGDCIACHTGTPAQGMAFAGGLPIDTPFGTFYTPNITPDQATGIGSWDELDFIRAMREGIRANGANLFPSFPYVYFNRMREADLKDLWAYFQAIPAIEHNNQGNTLPFPLNVRFAQYGWKLFFFYPDRGTYQDDPSQSESWNRGAYLVNGLGHCSMCHTPMNLLGAAQSSYFLTGAFIEGYWAPDITRRGLETASHFEVADVFSEGQLINRAGDIRGPMSDVNHDSLQYLTDDDRLAIVAYLKSIVSKQPRNLPAKLDTQPPMKRGHQVYANVCEICHLEGKVGAPRIGNQADWEYRLQQRGVNSLYTHAIDGYNKMPPKGACVTCNDSDIRYAVDYILYHSLEHSAWERLQNPPLLARKQATGPEIGQQIYQTHCASCHNRGTAGAPRLGDTPYWSERLTQTTMDVLIVHTLRGKGAMPAKGGCHTCSSSEIIAAVKYLIEESVPESDYSLW